MDLSQDVILAFKQNGRLLTPDHGFPLRQGLPLVCLDPGMDGSPIWVSRVCLHNNCNTFLGRAA